VLKLALAAVALYLVAALWGLARGKPSLAIVYLASAVAGGLATLAALSFLAAGDGTLAVTLPLGLPWLGAHLRLDPLAAFFVLLVNLVAGLVSVYAVGYAHHDEEPERALPAYPAFLAGMNLVLLADDAYVFLVSWEFMSLTSWLLVLANHRQSGTARAAYVYIVMASLGTIALLLAFGLLAGPDGDYGFAAIRAAAHPAARATLVVFLLLLGAGSKAGLVPLHAWLPLAHPAAPSHVSALMSGVMTKVALYAMIRVLFDLVGAPLWWWGAALLVVGGITAPIGVLYAIMQRDLKTLLAYSTVENIGIAAIGLGLALAFKASGLAGLAVLAFAAALFHALNHALFKSLLFLGAGAVVTATGERDMERLGGLIHRLPVTAVAVLIGSAAISALPPLNGFISEWLTFQALLAGVQLPQWLLKFALPVVGAMLALSAAFAAVCFVKVYGVTFLGRPRSDAAALAVEVGGTMTAPMIVLAALSVLAGIFPSGAIAAFAPALRQLFPGAVLPFGQSSLLWLVPLDAEQSSYSGLIVLVAVAGLMILVSWTVHRFASARLRRAPAWDCGFPDPRPATQYSGASFAQPIRRVFGAALFRARDVVDMPPPGEMRPARLDIVMRDLIWDGLYAPVALLVEAATTRINALQFLTIRRYLTLMFAALVALLSIVALSQ
jgi:formate hydrogenlyase subunit 3/multisubunit Na+/H+ antiporter MnhD subunit